VRDVLLLKAGSAAPSVRRALGDYDRWFMRSLGTARCRFRVVNADLGEPLPRARDFDAVVVTGSPRSVTERAPWMRRAASWLREASDERVPVLGVCFGHQLLGEAFGGRVHRNPLGREIGTVACSLTEAGRADPLFEGFPRTFEVQATHEDVVADAPPEVEILASNAAAACQAFRVGPFVRAVQFHPEMDAAAVRALAEVRVPQLEAEALARGEDPKARVRAVLAGVRETPFGRRVLERFIERFT